MWYVIATFLGAVMGFILTALVVAAGYTEAKREVYKKGFAAGRAFERAQNYTAGENDDTTAGSDEDA